MQQIINKPGYILNNTCDMNIKTLQCIDTEQPADTLEWCPNPNYSHYFVCGTYQLDDGETDFSKAPTSMTLFLRYLVFFYQYSFKLVFSQEESEESIYTNTMYISMTLNALI